jgi:thiosulfate/3-mercaptopyruvate sulfurtransferase
MLLILTALIMVSFAACANFDFSETGEYIVTPKDAQKLIEEGVTVVDVRSAEDYGLSHVKGAVNVPMSALTVAEPYANMLPEASKVEEVMGAVGITESDEILVYDAANNMQAARVQWTLNMYSNFNVRVISGGVEALKAQDVEFDSAKVEPEEAAYTAGDYQKSLIVNLDYLKSIINMPDENTVIIDTRSDEEYYAGTIPGSCHIEYVLNMYANGEYKSPRDIQSTYLAEGIKPDMKIILFCKTSVRAAQTYAALKDAGYKDVRIYDGAWLEYADKENPQPPSENIIPTRQDAS